MYLAQLGAQVQATAPASGLRTLYSLCACSAPMIAHVCRRLGERCCSRTSCLCTSRRAFSCGAVAYITSHVLWVPLAWCDRGGVDCATFGGNKGRHGARARERAVVGPFAQALAVWVLLLVLLLVVPRMLAAKARKRGQDGHDDHEHRA